MKRQGMALVEMVIDSVRRSMRNDEWVVLLKEKPTERYLPVYLDSSHADIIKKALCDQRRSGAAIDAPSQTEISRILSMADSVSLIIDRFENGRFHAKFLVVRRDKSSCIDCPSAKALALGVKAGARIFAEETVLVSAGIRAQV